MQRYHVIYADPPWRYNQRSNTTTKFGGGAMSHYNTMTIDDIKGLPINNISEDNSVLFLWVTFPKLIEGLDVMRSWGYTYKTLGFSWHKLNKDQSLFFGVGSYTKSNCEVCLFGTKGTVGLYRGVNNPRVKLEVRSNGISSALNHSRERHSKKPDQVRTRIEELFGDVSRVELFARETFDGWDSFGNQIENSITIKTEE